MTLATRSHGHHQIQTAIGESSGSAIEDKHTAAKCALRFLSKSMNAEITQSEATGSDVDTRLGVADQLWLKKK